MVENVNAVEGKSQYKPRKTKSQIRDVVEYLRANGSITSWEAWEKFHITRLSAIIHRLRLLGYDIYVDCESGKNEYGMYNYARYGLNPYSVPENDVFACNFDSEG